MTIRSSQQGLDDFRKRRVSVHGELQIVERGAGVDGVGRLVNQISGVQAEDPHAQDFAGGRVVDQLGHTVAFLLRESLRVRLEGGLADGDFEAFLFALGASLFLGQTDERHFGVGEARGRNRVVVEHVFVTHHVLDRANTLGARGVRQHHLAVGVADAPHALDNLAILVHHLHLLVDRNETSLR